MYFYLMHLSFWYTILCYSSVSSVKKRNFTSKGNTIFSQAAWFFFRILCRMDIYFKRLEYKQHILCCSSYSIFNLSWFFQCWKELAKMNTFFHPALDLSHIIASSSISLIILSIEDFLYLIRRLKVNPVFI